MPTLGPGVYRVHKLDTVNAQTGTVQELSGETASVFQRYTEPA